MSNKNIKDFLKELRTDIDKIVEDKSKKYDIPNYDVVMMLATGVYANNDEQMLVSVAHTSNTSEEMEVLLDGMDAVLNKMLEEEEPDQGTIDWWIKNSGGRDSSIN